MSLLTWEQDTFAYAESYDEDAGRYRGLRVAQTGPISEGDRGVVVLPEVARHQLDAEAKAAEVPEVRPPVNRSEESDGKDHIYEDPPEDKPAPPKVSRHHGSVRLDLTRVGRDAGAIADAVIAHLSGLMGANVQMTMEIEADIPDGTPDGVIRIVTENSRTLKFDDSGFEQE